MGNDFFCSLLFFFWHEVVVEEYPPPVCFFDYLEKEKILRIDIGWCGGLIIACKELWNREEKRKNRHVTEMAYTAMYYYHCYCYCYVRLLLLLLLVLRSINTATGTRYQACFSRQAGPFASRRAHILQWNHYPTLVCSNTPNTPSIIIRPWVV